jgi:hypothetical protein
VFENHLPYPQILASSVPARNWLDIRFSHTLADTRAKISRQVGPDGYMEWDTPTRVNASLRGSQHTEFLGNPHWIEIPQTLRTWIGSTNTTGRVWEDSTSMVAGYTNSNNRLNSTTVNHNWGPPGAGSSTVHGNILGTAVVAGVSGTNFIDWNTSARTNAHRWSFRFHLPYTTMVMFPDAPVRDNNGLPVVGPGGVPVSNSQRGRFEGRERDQFLNVDFTFRTKGSNTIWDLSTYTNTAGTSLDLPLGVRMIPDSFTPVDIPVTPGLEPAFLFDKIPPLTGRPHAWLVPWSRWVPPVQGPPDYDIPAIRPPDNWIRPSTPIISFDYSNPAESDKTTIGTH